MASDDDAVGEIFEAAIGYKTTGNTGFQQGQYDTAVDMYSLSASSFASLKEPPHDKDAALQVRIRTEEAKVHSNMAQVYLKQRNFKRAIEVASYAIDLDSGFHKAFYRRACAFEEVGNLAQARADVNECVRLAPDAKGLSDMMERLGCQPSPHSATTSSPKSRPSSSSASSTESSSTFSSQSTNTSRSSSSNNKKNRRKKNKKKNCEEPNSADTSSTESAHHKSPMLNSVPAEFMIGPSSWAEGLSESKSYEWLVDCYRMRVDDDYAWGGGYLHGLYLGPDRDEKEVLKDFLIFCKLADARGAIPTSVRAQPWNWSRFLRKAGAYLLYAFEKSDAQEKYGGENVFSPDRSLRRTAEQIYGQSIIDQDDNADSLFVRIDREIRRNFSDDSVEAAFDNPKQESILFSGVGGSKAWHRLSLQICVDPR